MNLKSKMSCFLLVGLLACSAQIVVAGGSQMVASAPPMPDSVMDNSQSSNELRAKFYQMFLEKVAPFALLKPGIKMREASKNDESYVLDLIQFKINQAATGNMLLRDLPSDIAEYVDLEGKEFVADFEAMKYLKDKVLFSFEYENKGFDAGSRRATVDFIAAIKSLKEDEMFKDYPAASLWFDQALETVGIKDLSFAVSLPVEKQQAVLKSVQTQYQDVLGRIEITEEDSDQIVSLRDLLQTSLVFQQAYEKLLYEDSHVKSVQEKDRNVDAPFLSLTPQDTSVDVPGINVHKSKNLSWLHTWGKRFVPTPVAQFFAKHSYIATSGAALFLLAGGLLGYRYLVTPKTPVSARYMLPGQLQMLPYVPQKEAAVIPVSQTQLLT